LPVNTKGSAARSIICQFFPKRYPRLKKMAAQKSAGSVEEEKRVKPHFGHTGYKRTYGAKSGKKSAEKYSLAAVLFKKDIHAANVLMPDFEKLISLLEIAPIHQVAQEKTQEVSQNGTGRS
jgi:hypothetical protein